MGDGIGEKDRPREGPEGFRCDFCGAVVPRVQRVVLDRDYERLGTPHPVKYACPPCSEAKERRRLGLQRS
jgi:predicted RNA-binding Zn-ribbon protein involved in translation (DUF1610 family)